MPAGRDAGNAAGHGRGGAGVLGALYGAGVAWGVIRRVSSSTRAGSAKNGSGNARRTGRVRRRNAARARVTVRWRAAARLRIGVGRRIGAGGRRGRGARHWRDRTVMAGQLLRIAASRATDTRSGTSGTTIQWHGGKTGQSGLGAAPGA